MMTKITTNPIAYLKLRKKDMRATAKIPNEAKERSDNDFIFQINPNEHVISNIRHCIKEDINLIIDYNNELFGVLGLKTLDSEIERYKKKEQPFINISVFSIGIDDKY